MIPAFTLKLGQQIQQNVVTVAKFDGKHPSLAAGTSGGRVFVHSPHTRTTGEGAAEEKDGGGEPKTRFLNFNRNLTALSSGAIHPGLTADDDETKLRDVLLVGMQMTLLAYDVEMNSDIFYKDVQDGVNSMAFGHVPGVENALAIVGGNCSIQGFDHEGAEAFWTVTGDNVSTLTLCDTDGKGRHELLVGSDDFEIRIFENEEVQVEVVEADRVVALTPIQLSKYGFGLANGTIGVYNRTKRIWRAKSKHKVSALAAYDLDADGVPELISCWSNGALTVRSEFNGEVIYRDTFAAPVAAALDADLRLEGKSQMIVCASDGEVRGYVAVDSEGAQAALDDGQDQKAIAELQARKQELLLEWRGLEENIKQATKPGHEQQGIVPQNTRVSMDMATNEFRTSFEFVFQTNNDTFILSVVIVDTDGGIFDGETLYSTPATPSNKCSLEVRPRKNVPAQLKIQIHVGARPVSTQLHVFEVDFALVKFCRFMRVHDPKDAPAPTSSVEFTVPEPLNRVTLWVERSFLNMGKLYQGGESGAALEVFYTTLREGDGADDRTKPLWIQAWKDTGTRVKVSCSDMEIAAEIVQDLCKFLQVSELTSTASFPLEMDAFRDILSKVSDYNATRIRLTAEMADSSNRVKTLVVKAEDARIMGSMQLMRRHYAELFTLNTSLVAEYVKRANNHQALLAALKDVNHMIQKASNLRMGAPKNRVVAECRQAIKANNISSLFQIIANGHDPQIGVVDASAGGAKSRD